MDNTTIDLKAHPAEQQFHIDNIQLEKSIQNPSILAICGNVTKHKRNTRMTPTYL